MAGVEPVEPLPSYTTALPPPELLSGPFRIGIQSGHWKIDELPDELTRLRSSTGAAFGSLRESDINLAVARDLALRLMAKGYAVDLLPATVPPAYRADLFVSIHADRADLPHRQGWKLAPPWRASPWSSALGEALSAAFRAAGLPEDRGGVTANMRGYFGFSWRRFEHAISPYTPAVLVELGFLGNAVERARLRDRPDYYAAILEKGIEAYLADYERNNLSAYVPQVFPRLVAGLSGARLRAGPDRVSALLETVDSGRSIMVVGRRGDWYEVYARAARMPAWVPMSELVPAPTPEPSPGWDAGVRDPREAR